MKAAYVPNKALRIVLLDNRVEYRSYIYLSLCKITLTLWLDRD